MKSHRHVIHVSCPRTVDVLDISDEVARALAESGIAEGFCLVFPLHTTAAVFINDSDSSVTRDLLDVLERMAPADGTYRHDRVDPKANAHGHIKGSLLGHHVTLPVTDGRLDLGTYHTIYYAELDGGRPKQILVKIIGA
jgi:secondary thiamine-phosphate synthase enzyme